ncbi:unnamed protein product [Knipowitschia caucasica]
MVKRMGGNRPDWDYPVLISEQGTAVSDTDKAEVLAQNFAMVHSVGNLSGGKLRLEPNLLMIWCGKCL